MHYVLKSVIFKISANLYIVSLPTCCSALIRMKKSSLFCDSFHHLIQEATLFMKVIFIPIVSVIGLLNLHLLNQVISISWILQNLPEEDLSSRQSGIFWQKEIAKNCAILLLRGTMKEGSGIFFFFFAALDTIVFSLQVTNFFIALTERMQVHKRLNYVKYYFPL